MTELKPRWHRVLALLGKRVVLKDLHHVPTEVSLVTSADVREGHHLFAITHLTSSGIEVIRVYLDVHEIPAEERGYYVAVVLEEKK